MASERCPCCDGAAFEHLLSFGRVPLSGIYRSTAAEDLPETDLSFQLCVQCGLVRQEGSGTLRNYSDIDRPTTRQFPSYGDELIAQLGSRGVAPTDLVLEIGCNDGSFLERLRAAGFRRVVGVEPAHGLAAEATGRGFSVIEGYFGPSLVPTLLEKYGPVSAAICRHTLEHVPAPRVFASAIASCLDRSRGIALIEVPDGAVIPDKMNVQEFWDEHLHYFSSANLRQLLCAAELRISDLDVRPHLDTRNLVVWCSAVAKRAAVAGTAESRSDVQSWRGFISEWDKCRRRITESLSPAPRPVYAIGAAHPQCNFVNYAGISRLVDYFIDDDPAKVGRFPPVGAGRASVISTAEFEASAQSGTILKTGFGYPQWTAHICRHALRHGMHIVDPRAS